MYHHGAPRSYQEFCCDFSLLATKCAARRPPTCAPRTDCSASHRDQHISATLVERCWRESHIAIAAISSALSWGGHSLTCLYSAIMQMPVHCGELIAEAVDGLESWNVKCRGDVMKEKGISLRIWCNRNECKREN
jgi:hypothetical protein